MDNIEKNIAFVKDQMVAQRGMAQKYEDNPHRASRHLATAQRFQDLLEFLEKIQSGQDVSAKENVKLAKKMALTLSDIEDLPEEMIRELNVSETDRLEMTIEQIISSEGGILSLDRIMVELYRRTAEIHKRNTLVSRLFRMVQRGVIYNVPGKKGVYSTREIPESDVEKLFGDSIVEMSD